jgi:ATP-dependent Lon protease
MSTIIPLFPLPNVVLFPGMILPLHIFEPRYRAMIKDAMAHDAQFGLVLCHDYDPTTMNGIPFHVGTVAEIIECDIMADGRMNILTMGTQRFHVTRFDADSKPYLQGEVEWIDDVKDGYVTKKLIGETTTLFNEAIRMTQKLRRIDPQAIQLPDDPTDISFCIAENLKGSLVLKQELLEMDSTKERLCSEREILTRMVKSLAVRTQIEDVFQEGSTE